MRTTNDFYDELTTLMQTEIDECNKITKQIDRISERIASGHFSKDYINDELQPQKKSLEQEIMRRKDDAMDKVTMLCDDYAAELYEADCLDVSQLTDDVRLLQSGIRLTDRDLRKLISRAEGNPTMLQVLLRYGQDNDLDCGGVSFRGNTDVIRSVKGVPEIARTALKWHKNPSIYDRLFGSESALARGFGGDE